MAVRKVCEFPEPVLRKKTRIVSKFNKELEALAKDMFETMYLNNGVGLSANQIGINKKMAVINPTGRKENELVLVNPEIVSRKGAETMEEGCLSVSNVNAPVKRSDRIRVRFMDLHGRQHEAEFEGLKSRIVQHEVDHLNGLIFVNRLGAIKRSFLMKKIKKRRK